MMIRMLAALVLGSAAGVGALYGASRIVPTETAPSPAPAPASEAAAPEPEAPMGEPPLDLPYGEGEAAAWLAAVLAGTGPYPAGDGAVDLAAWAARAAEPQPPRPVEPQVGDSHAETVAECQAGHVALACTITRTFTSWQDAFGASESAELYTFSLQQDETGWRVMDGSVRVLHAG